MAGEVIIRYEIVVGNGEHTLMVELSDHDLADIGTAYIGEDDECEALAYVGRACTGLTVEEAKRNLEARRVELIRASAVIK